MNHPEDNLTPIGDCRRCRYRMNLLLGGRCMPGDACIAVDSGRQMDRFLRINPELAPHYLTDSFWERRAIAVRYVPLEALPPLIKDSDEAVRRARVQPQIADKSDC